MYVSHARGQVVCFHILEHTDENGSVGRRAASCAAGQEETDQLRDNLPALHALNDERRPGNGSTQRRAGHKKSSTRHNLPELFDRSFFDGSIAIRISDLNLTEQIENSRKTVRIGPPPP